MNINQQIIVTRNNIVRKLARGYCSCYCKTFLLVPDSTECTKIFLPKCAVHYLYHLKPNNIIGQRKTTNSSFRLTSLIYAEKFEFENPAIMEAKQCKQTERFSVMAKKSDYFLSLDDESKQKYNVKINNIQGNDPYQIKKEELSGDFSKLPPVQ